MEDKTEFGSQNYEEKVFNHQKGLIVNPYFNLNLKSSVFQAYFSILHLNFIYHSSEVLFMF